MEVINKGNKNENKIKTILIIAVAVAVALLYNYHKDQTRAEYAQNNDCVWAISGSYDICK